MIITAAASIYLIAAGALPGGPADDSFTRSAEVVKYSFEDAKDSEFDQQPIGWSRRMGRGFPWYVQAKIDRKLRHDGTQSLRFDVNGGRAIYYSPPTQIDALHSYVLEGWVRTQGLKHDAALISISFLNYEKKRVERILSKPVSGTHHGWIRVRIGPFSPTSDIRFVVVGCHLAHGKMMDFRGHAWFDSIRVGRLPRLSLVTNFHAHFKIPDARIEIKAEAGGLDPGNRYQLRLQMFNNEDQQVGQMIRKLTVRGARGTNVSANSLEKPHEVIWHVPRKPHGYYSIRADLQRNGQVILTKSTTFAVMDLI